jgi:hypothetical protein
MSRGYQPQRYPETSFPGVNFKEIYMRGDIVLELLCEEVVKLRDELAVKSSLLKALDERIANMKATLPVAQKRGPGRPRKNEAKIKRGPGRPRKNS